MHKDEHILSPMMTLFYVCSASIIAPFCVSGSQNVHLPEMMLIWILHIFKTIQMMMTMPHS
jgi:hypothetical protein